MPEKDFAEDEGFKKVARLPSIDSDASAGGRFRNESGDSDVVRVNGKDESLTFDEDKMEIGRHYTVKFLGRDVTLIKTDEFVEFYYGPYNGTASAIINAFRGLLPSRNGPAYRLPRHAGGDNANSPRATRAEQVYVNESNELVYNPKYMEVGRRYELDWNGSRMMLVKTESGVEWYESVGKKEAVMSAVRGLCRAIKR